MCVCVCTCAHVCVFKRDSFKIQFQIRDQKVIVEMPDIFYENRFIYLGL